MEKIYDRLKKLLHNLLPKKIEIKKIKLQKEIISEIIRQAKAHFPKEFISLLQGKIENNILEINNLIYQEYYSSEKSATMNFDLPMVSGVVGSVHSHPSVSNSPSQQDLQFFSKKGYVHIIISYPFKKENMACYDFKGRRIDCEIY